MHEMMDFQLWKQRREETLREMELNRLAKALRQLASGERAGDRLWYWRRRGKPDVSSSF